MLEVALSELEALAEGVRKGWEYSRGVLLKRIAFRSHAEHSWSVVDGSAWCDDCAMHIVHPTEAEFLEAGLRR